jgi:hypothetical protein
MWGKRSTKEREDQEKAIALKTRLVSVWGAESDRKVAESPLEAAETPATAGYAEDQDADSGTAHAVSNLKSTTLAATTPPPAEARGSEGEEPPAALDATLSRVAQRSKVMNRRLSSTPLSLGLHEPARAVPPKQTNGEMAATTDPAASRRPDAAQVTTASGSTHSAWNAEYATETQLKIFEENLTRIASKIVSQAQASMHRTVARLESSLAQVEEMNSSIDASFASFSRRTGEVADARARAFEDSLARMCEQTVSEAHASLQDEVADSAESLGRSLEQQIASFTERLRASEVQSNRVLARVGELRQQCDSRVEELVPEIRDLGREAMRSEMENLKVTAREELKAYASSVAEESRGQAESVLSAATDEFIERESRSRLQEALRQFRERDAQGLSTEIQKVYSEERDAVIRRLKKESEELGGAASRQIQTGCERSLNDALDRMHDRLLDAATLLREREDKIVERLEAQLQERFEAVSGAQLEAFRNQAGDFPTALLNQVRAESEAIAHSLCDRLRSDTQLLETRLVEAIEGKLKKAAEELIQSSNLRMRDVSERNVMVAKTAMIRLQRQSISEAPRVLREKIGDALAVLQKGLGRIAEDIQEEADESLGGANAMLPASSGGFLEGDEDNVTPEERAGLEALVEPQLGARLEARLEETHEASLAGNSW